MLTELLYRSVFNELDRTGKGFVSAKDLVRSMNNRRSSIAKVFGASSTGRALDAFNKLDGGGKGRVTYADFMQNAELAFTNVITEKRDVPIAATAEPILGRTRPPRPPPMTRELLYRSVFNEVDSKNQGHITQLQLVKAMSTRRGSIAKIFGTQSTERAITVFGKLDSAGEGRVSFEQFYRNCETAFVPEGDEDEKEEELVQFPEAAPADGGSAPVPPTPPPMTREMLYRSVYDAIDTRKAGSISQMDLVKAASGGRRSSIAKVFGDAATAHAIDAFRAMDQSGSGRVTWTQFFDKCEESFVTAPRERINAPRRPSLLPPAPVEQGRRPSLPPSLPPGKLISE